MSRRDAVNAAISGLDKRTKIMIGALVVVLLGVAGFFLLKPGSSASNTAATPIPTQQGATTPTSTPTPTPSASSPGLAAQANPGRDPFAPLAAESASSGSSTATVAAVTNTTGATTTSPIVPTPSASAGHTLTLVSITNGSADLTVDGKDKAVKAGATVATGVACVKVTTEAVFVTYQSKAYAIAPGQTVTF